MPHVSKGNDLPAGQMSLEKLSARQSQMGQEMHQVPEGNEVPERQVLHQEDSLPERHPQMGQEMP